MKAQRELEDALDALGWTLDGPTRTPGGWKATIHRGAIGVLATGGTTEQVLEELVRSAHQRARGDLPQEQPH